MLVRPLLPALLGLVLALSAPAADPAVAHKTIPAVLKEAKALRVPALVVLTKAKANAPVAVSDPRVIRASQSVACATVVLTPALAKQYDLDGDAHTLLLDPEGTLLEQFAADADRERVLAAITKRTDAARAELVKSVKPDASAKERTATLNGLMRVGPFAEDLVLFLTDPDATIKATARKALAALPPESAASPLLDALKSGDPAVRAAVHPFAVQATGYKGAPLKVWQSGTDEERAAAWEKWNAAVQAQFPPLNRAVLAFCEQNLGVQVNNGECAMLVIDAYAACKAQQKVNSGDSYIWGRQLKSGEPVLPGDIAQFEQTKFSNGRSYPHHTAVIRKVLAPGKFETLEQNVGGKTVKPGKLDLTALKEGTVVVYRPQPK